jgi:hypothetical protein
MRAFYLFTAVSMTAKFVILNRYSEETERGRIRLEQTQNRSLFSLVAGTLRILRTVFTTRGTFAAAVVFLYPAIYNTVRGTFFAILLTQGLGFTAGEVGWFPALRSVVMLLFIFLVIPRLRQDRHIGYLIVGLGATAVATVLLIVAPVRGWTLVIISTVIEAAGAAVLAPYGEGFVTAAVEPAERARTLSVINLIVLALSSPFGWIAGLLSERGKTLPFLLIIGVLVVTMAALALANPERRK